MAVIVPFESPSNASIDALVGLVAADMERVNATILSRTGSEVTMIPEVANHLISSGGKRLRPMLTLAMAGLTGYSGDGHIKLAASVEFMHTATLLHDDVVDESELRRGKLSARMLWGNEASVLVGDFLYSRAFQMMVDLERMRVLDILADATNTIAEGEVMQLVNCHDPETTEERYLHTIRFKTAKLFEAAAQLGAVIADAGPELEATLGCYGRHLGTAFQLVDDALDYSATDEQLGKNIGDDLAEGKPTLPLLYAMWRGTPGQAAIIRAAILEGGRERIKEISAAIESTGAITYTFALAEAEATKARTALAAVPRSPYLDALQALTRFAVERQS